jgi:CheY-like chemotaxis protein
MELLMELWNYGLDVVQNGKEAVERVKEHAYDLVITDIRMPVMDGYEAARTIRSLDLPWYQPIMIISATEAPEECFKAGADDFLEKPYDCDALRKKIYEMTSKVISIGSKNGKLIIEEIMPADRNQFLKLRDLRKEGLGLFRFFQTGVVIITSENAKFQTSADFEKSPIRPSFLLRGKAANQILS